MTTLPPTLHRKWGHLSCLRRRAAKEWSAVCPHCGDSGHVGPDLPDRFRIFGDDKPLGWCRKCGHLEFLGGPAHRPDDKTLAEFRARQLDIELLRKQAAERAIRHLNDERLWEHYFQLAGQSAQQWWRDQGIPDGWQRYLKLGYCPSNIVHHNGREHRTPTYTIPVFDIGWNCVNIRHRLAAPPAPNDKYRPERAGLPSALYLTCPAKPLADRVIAVEGEKKAIVTASRLMPDPEKVSVVGLPGMSPSDEILARLDHAQRVVLILDPDADPTRIAKRYGRRARVVHLPVKVDDGFVRYGLEVHDLNTMIRRAVVI